VKLSDNVQELGRVTGKSGSCGWMFDEVAWFLHALVGLVRPEIVIQTGHLWGKSACVILNALTYELKIEGNAPQGDGAFDSFVREHTRPLGGKLISIDPGPVGVANNAAGFEFLTQTYGNRFVYRNMLSEEFFADVKTKDLYLGKRILGVVDGDHHVEGCMGDLRGLMKLCAEVIFVDDTTYVPELYSVCVKSAVVHDYQFLNLQYLNGVGLLVRKDMMP
jgi:hypothetical protein